MDPEAAHDHWPLHARQWARIGVPLRPAAGDVAIAERAVAEWHARTGRPPRALLLGVTPELAAMRWPPGTVLFAVDRSAAMVEAVFPANRAPGTARVGDWLALADPAASFDVVLGDGCLVCLRYPVDHRALAAELRRVIAPDGVAVLRLFALPEAPEVDTLDRLAGAVRAGAGDVANFHAFKWQLAMALAARTPDRRVPVVEILRAFEAIAPDRAALPWPREVVDTIDAYRGSDAIYAFPTAAETRVVLAPHFTVVRTEQVNDDPRIPHPARYPSLVLRPT